MKPQDLFKPRIDWVFNILENIINTIYILQKNKTHIKVLSFYPSNVSTMDKIIMFYIISFEHNRMSTNMNNGNIFYFEILTNRLLPIISNTAPNVR